MIANSHIKKAAYDGTLSTVAAMQAQYEDLRCDYSAAKETRFQKRPDGIFSQGSGADYHYRNASDYYYMIELFRNMVRNDQFVSQGIRTLVANIVLDGFTVKPKTGDRNLDDNLEERWKNWTADENVNVDFERKKNWHTIEQLGLESIIVDGDCG